LLILLALGLTHLDLQLPTVSGALHGLKLAAVAVIAHAVWGMGRTLCPDTPRRALALAVTVLALVWSGAWAQVWLIVGAMALGAVVGRTPSLAQAELGADATLRERTSSTTPHRGAGSAGVVWLVLFAVFLVGLPALARATGSAAAEMAAVFYKAGALVFGGGHVVLPLLQAEVMPRGWLSLDGFLAGYGAAQAVPGPLFTFAAFVGAARAQAPNGWGGGLLALVAVFLPGFLLLMAALPLWARLRHLPRARNALAAVNAAVVGLLLATWLNLLGASIGRASDVLIALVAALALMSARVPPWAVALGCALAGASFASA
jgi:chromate transporter